MSQASADAPAKVVWETAVAVEDVNGVPFKMYTNRPRRIEDLLAFATRWGDRPVVIQGERVLTFAELVRLADSKADQLTAAGLRAGQKVFIMAFNSPDYLINCWAVLRAGAVPVLLNAWWSEAEVVAALDLLQPSLVLTDERAAGKIPAKWTSADWTNPGTAEASAADRPSSSDENAPATIIFTSGTSGQPKAVVLSHRALLANLQMLLHMTKRLPQQVTEKSGEVILHTGPLFHVGGIQAMLRAVMVGNTFVLPKGRFDPAEVLELVERHKVNRWSAVPTMVSRVLDHPDVSRRQLGSLRALTMGGSPLHPELQERVRTGLPGAEARIATGYGLSENGGQATAASDADTVQRPGTSGRPLPLAEIQIVPRLGLPDGEILIRAPTQMSEYFGLADQPIDAEGWLSTGDLGRVDGDGFLWITGRCKDLIIRGGENIAPAAVEKAILSAPGVRDAVVFGLPHADLGEEVAAVVVMEAGAAQETVKEHLRSSVASFSVPSWWRFQTDELPVNATGKIDKAMIVTQVRSERAQAYSASEAG